jgi:hypothetical protein
VELQIRRIDQMDENLYDDKLSGAITKERYEVKHEQFLKGQEELYKQLSEVGSSIDNANEQRLAILELSQKAAQIYEMRSPEDKRLIISKLFTNLCLKDGSVSVTYSKLVYIIAEKVIRTRKLMEV